MEVHRAILPREEDRARVHKPSSGAAARAKIAAAQRVRWAKAKSRYNSDEGYSIKWSQPHESRRSQETLGADEGTMGCTEEGYSSKSSKKNKGWEGVCIIANSVVSNRQARLATKAYLKRHLKMSLNEAELGALAGLTKEFAEMLGEVNKLTAHEAADLLEQLKMNRDKITRSTSAAAWFIHFRPLADEPGALFHT